MVTILMFLSSARRDLLMAEVSEMRRPVTGAARKVMLVHENIDVILNMILLVFEKR